MPREENRKRWSHALLNSHEEPYPGFHKLFDRFEDLHRSTHKKHSAATHEVRTLEEEQWTNRKTWWHGYGQQHGTHTDGELLNFFKAWFLYRPRPEGTLEAPSDDKPFGSPDGPGYFIERWDWVANTANGTDLNMDDRRWRRWFKDFLDMRGNYLKTEFSWPTGLSEAWTSYKGDPNQEHPFDMEEYHVPKGGFRCFNDFFLRWCKDLDCQRPVEDEDNPLAVSAPADGGVFYLSRDDSDAKARFTLPCKSGDTFHLMDTFPAPYGKKFVGGPLLDTLLWFTDFHHFFAPVSGELVFTKTYQGSYNYDFDNYDDDCTDFAKPTTGDRVGWYNDLGKHKRHLWVFKTEKMGYVGMCAVGFWGVGSIVTEPDPMAPHTWAGGYDAPVPQRGDHVKKGQYLGHFGYGGSSIVLAFEPRLGRFKDLIYNFIDVGEPEKPHLVKARQTIGLVSIEHAPMKSRL